MAVKISRILHAGYVFECEGTQIAFDTIFENPFSRNCHAFPNVEFDHEEIKQLKFSAVFISHFHDDHCSLESLNLLDRSTPIYLFCIHEEMFSWIKELGFTEVLSLALNQPVNVGSFEIIPRRALDADVDSLFQIKAAGLNILNVVDSWIDYDTLDLLVEEKPWDMILWPFQTMRELEVIAPSRFPAAPDELPPEWIEQLKKLAPKNVIPSSCQFILENWSWYNNAFFPVSYKQFALEVGRALPVTNVVRLNPGTSIILKKNSLENASRLIWVKPIGDQDVDYKYVRNLKPPSTAEIARHFPLAPEQKERVLAYCQKGLLEKFSSMEPPMDEYFEKPRLWRLSLYDDQGVVTQFHYNLDGSDIELLAAWDDALAWTTEVPIAKVYAALELGESLTSMYMRINDVIFDSKIETEIEGADIVEDPLVRCLFNAHFGAYQLAQFKKIIGRAPRVLLQHDLENR